MQTNDLASVWSSFKGYLRSSNFWRLVSIGLISILPIGLFVGFAFMLIAQGIFFLLLRLTPFWESARKLFGTLAPPISDKTRTWGWWKWLFVFLYSIPSILLIVAGLWILTITGFKNQNFIYLLFLK